MNHLIRALTILMAVGFSLSATAQVLEKSAKAPAKTEKKRNPLEACFTAFEKTEGSLTGTFYTGATYKVELDATGKPHTYTYTSPGGDEVAAPVSLDSVTRDAVTSAESNAEVARLRAKMSAMMKEAIGIGCKRMIAKNRKTVALASESGSLAQNKNVEGDAEFGTNGEYDWFLPEWTLELSEDDFYAEADYVAGEWFVGEVESRQVPRAPTVQCVEVINDCKTTCDRVGALGGGVMCGALGATAGIFLSPPIGIAVGAYCGGKVFVKVEECRGGCNMPAIECRY